MAALDVPGAPCWIDLMTSDRAGAAAFYGELFGWDIDDPGPDYGGYQNFMLEGRHTGGLMQATPDMGVSDVWSVYLSSADAHATVAAAKDAGSQVHVEAMAVMSLGTMAVVTDPGGATIGIWQPGDHDGFGVVGEVGSASWFELHTRDYEAVVPFYRDVFGWDAHTMADTPEFRYTTLGEGDDARAGIMDAAAFLPDGVPSCWQVYFQVDETDAALDRLSGLGGAVVQQAEDTPYGRIATASDPYGAIFKLRGPNVG